VGDEVVGAGAHYIHTGVILGCARNEDERDIETGLLDEVKRICSAERGHLVVGYDHIPALLVEGSPERIGGPHAGPDRLVALFRQLIYYQQGIVLGIVHYEEPDRGSALIHGPETPLGHLLLILASALRYDIHQSVVADDLENSLGVAALRHKHFEPLSP
jgi:hypothetical protein